MAQLARPDSRFAGGSNQNFQAGFALIDDTKSRNSATPAMSITCPNAAPIATSTAKNTSSEPAGRASCNMLKLYAQVQELPMTPKAAAPHAVASLFFGTQAGRTPLPRRARTPFEAAGRFSPNPSSPRASVPARFGAAVSRDGAP